MARRTDKNGVSWEVDAQGNPVPGTGIRPGNMKADPMKPVALQKATNEADASAYAPAIERERLAGMEQDRQIERERLEFEKRKTNAALAQKGLRMLPDGRVVPLEGGAPKAAKDTTERRAQIKSILDNIGNLRKQADDWLAVGNQSSKVGEWPLVGGMLGQNRADVEGILKMLQGDMIQQQIAIMSENNGGKGVASMANGIVEAERMASSIANLDPNQTYDQFMQGVQKAEDYYNRQLEAMGPEKTRADFKRGDGVETSFEGGDYLTDDDQRVGKILQFRFNQGGGANELNEALKAENVKRKQKGLEPYDLYRPGTKQWQTLGEAVKFRNSGGEGAKISAPVSGYQESSFLGDVADSNFGALGMKYGNAAAFGLPAFTDIGNTNMALDYAGENYPEASFIGETGGLITGAAGLGALGGKVAGKYAPNLLNGGKWGATGRGVATDGTQGLAYGGFNDGDALTGAASMGGGRLLGDGVGRVGARMLRKPVMNLAGMDYAPALQKPDALTLGRIGEDSVTQLQDAQRLGMPMSLADTTPALQKLAGSAVRKSDDALTYAKQNIDPRGMGQADRAQNAIATQLAPPVDPKVLGAEIRQQAQTAADPYYKEAFARPAPVNEELAELLKNPTLQESLGDAARIASNEGKDPLGLGFDFNDAGDVIGVQNPTWETLDLIKRGIDQKLQPYRDPFGRLNTEGNPLAQSIEGLRKRYVGVLDNQVGADDYKTARGVYADAIAPRASLDMGQKAFSGRVVPRDVESALARLNVPQLETYKKGFATAAADQVDRVRDVSNPYKSVYGSPAQRDKVNAIFPGNEFGKIYDIEDSMAATRAETLYGSQTGARAEADKTFSNNAVANAAEMGGAAATGGLPFNVMARTALGALGDSARLRGGEKVAGEIAPILLNTNPASSLQYLEEAFIKKAAYEAQRAQARRLGGIFGSGGGPLLYSSTQGN